MKVCHVVNGLPIGGKERLVVDLCRESAGEASACVVVINDLVNQALVDELEMGGHHVVRLGRKLKGGNLSPVMRLRELIRRNGYDVIHAHDCLSVLYAMVASLFLGVGIVVTVHSNKFIETPVPRIVLRNLLSLFVERIVFISNSAKESFRAAIPYPEGKTSIVPNGISLGRFKPGSNGGRPVAIVSVGRLVPEIKGQDLLLRALGEIKARGLEFTCVFVGDGPGFDALVALAESLGLAGEVSFVGSDINVSRYYSSADIFVLASRREGFGIVLLEAMASGLAIISSNSGGPGEIISHGKNGLLYQPEDVGALSNHLSTLITDDHFRSELSRQALQDVRMYSVEEMSNKYVDIYKSVSRCAGVAIAVLAFLLSSSPCSAVKYIDFVNGSDGNPGTLERPLKTPDNARWTFVEGNGKKLSWDSDSTWAFNSCVEHVYSGNIRAQGSKGLPKTLTSYGGCGRAAITADTAKAAFIVDGKQWLSIENLQFKGVSSDFGESVRIKDSSHIQVKNCEFLGGAGNQRGVWIYGDSQDCSIVSCSFDQLQTGIVATASENGNPKRLSVLWSSFRNITSGEQSGADGIAFGLSKDRLSYDYDYSVIQGNVFENVADQAIDICGANNVIIAGNYINCGRGNRGGDGDGIKLGLDAPYTFGHYLLDNVVLNVKTDFIYAGSASYVLINNTFNHAGRNAITHSVQKRPIVILNNIFANIGEKSARSTFLEQIPSVAGPVEGNIYYNGVVRNCSFANGLADWAVYRKATGWDQNSLFGVDPMLSERGSPLPGSPALNAARASSVDAVAKLLPGQVLKFYRPSPNIGASVADRPGAQNPSHPIDAKRQE